MVHRLRHASAAGDWSVNLWDLDSVDEAVLAVVRLGRAAPIYVTVPIRGPRGRDERRLLIWPVEHDSSWGVEGAVLRGWGSDVTIRPDRLVSQAELPSDSVRLSLMLSNTPPDVDEELRRIVMADEEVTKHVCPRCKGVHDVDLERVETAATYSAHYRRCWLCRGDGVVTVLLARRWVNAGEPWTMPPGWS
jgi:hypothetical protein